MDDRDARDVLSVENLRRTYRIGDHEVHALQGVTLGIRRGEFVAVMGPSGSGKSTFMNLIGCLDRPDGGRYLLDDRDVSALSSDDLAAVRNAKIGFVFQSFNLLARTSALENVELPLVYAGVATDERHRRAKAALAAVGLEDRASHLPSQLSGGQQQRVAIARAIVNEPRILLADEPTGNLDSRTSEDVLAFLTGLAAKRSLTIVLVTHEDEVSKWARRVVTFRDGLVVSDVAQEGRAA